MSPLIDYLAEIEEFYDWLAVNPLAPSAICLWHALMSVAYKAAWPEDFSVAISTLQSRTGLGKDAIYKARNQLKQAGRIRFRERKGRQSTQYEIGYFASGFASEKPTQPYTQSGHNDFTSDIASEKPTQTYTQNRHKPFVSEKPTQMATQTYTQSRRNQRTIGSIDQTDQIEGSIDPRAREEIQYWEDLSGKPASSGLTAEIRAALLSNADPMLVREALKFCVGKRSPERYFATCLQNWKMENITTHQEYMQNKGKKTASATGNVFLELLEETQNEQNGNA